MKLLLRSLLLFCSFCLLSYAPPFNIKSILKTGNGKSIKTAYRVSSVKEEYEVLRYLNLKSIAQKMCIKDGIFLDEITTNSGIIFFRIVNKKLPNKVMPQIL